MLQLQCCAALARYFSACFEGKTEYFAACRAQDRAGTAKHARSGRCRSQGDVFGQLMSTVHSLRMVPTSGWSSPSQGCALRRLQGNRNLEEQGQSEEMWAVGWTRGGEGRLGVNRGWLPTAISSPSISGSPCSHPIPQELGAWLLHGLGGSLGVSEVRMLTRNLSQM